MSFGGQKQVETVKKACGSFGLGSQRSAIRFIFRHVRHYAKPASPGQWWRHGHHHVVGRDRERYDLVDDRRDMATGTPRAVRGRLVAGLEYGGGDQHQCPVRHLPLGWGFSSSQDFNGDIALIACFASSWTPAMVRRWHADPFGSCVHGTKCLRSLAAPTRHAPLDRHGRGHVPHGIASSGCQQHRLAIER